MSLCYKALAPRLVLQEKALEHCNQNSRCSAAVMLDLSPSHKQAVGPVETSGGIWRWNIHSNMEGIAPLTQNLLRYNSPHVV